MYNVEKLEQQWIQYRRKKIIVPAASILLGVSVIMATVYVLDTYTSVFNANSSTTMRSVSSEKNASTIVQGSASQKKTIEKIESLATEVPSLGSEQTSKDLKAGRITFQDSPQAPEKKVRKRKNLLIHVTERGNKDITTDIENRFEFAKDKRDSLFLAKYYYDKMDYSKAEKWALETNKLDNTIEESWLIFAKALVWQKKRIEALKVLKAFSDQSGSTKAKSLIDKIRRGKRF